MSHFPYYIGAALGGLIIVSIAVFTMFRTETPGESSTWQSVGGLFSAGDPLRTPPREDDTYRGESVETLGVIPLPPKPDDTEAQTFATDLADLLANLTQPPKVTASEPEDAAPSAYSFIPSGLVTMGTPTSRSPEAQALYDYGNTIGGSLQSFADLHPNMVQTLKDQAEDRTNALKKDAVKRLANDFSRLGDEIAAIGSVPPVAASAHAALAAAYRDVGAKLALIPDASGDAEFLAAINTYNATAEELSKRLVALADIFGSRNVGFTSSDPGNIFIFNGNAPF